ncbi:hypothetical protein KAH81_05610 [bacterium]|nr:hypothetical protein [bacterium]
MNIKIVNDQVVIELSALEFAAFESMFQNLNDNHAIIIEGCEWPEWSIYQGEYTKPVLPMHLCRTIGEACAVESAGPLDLMSLYPFWKYGFCFSEGENLRLSFSEIDPHKKANLSDEFGMGFCAWAMEEIFHCEAWCDTADALDQNEVEALGLSRPDFVCTFPDGSFGIFEAKGTTTGRSSANSQASDGKYQTTQIVPTSGIVRVRCCTAVSLERDSASNNTRLLLLDPPSADVTVKVNISRNRILAAARSRAYREKIFGDITTMFKFEDKSLALVRKPFVPGKRHGWLNIA